MYSKYHRSFLGWDVLFLLKSGTDFGVEVGQVLEVCFVVVFVLLQVELLVGK